MENSVHHKDKDSHRIQKKLARQGITLAQILQEEGIVQMFRSNNPALHNYLKFQDFKEMVTFVTVVGPPEDKIRSYKLPQVATDILSSEIPRILEVMFAPEVQPSNTPSLINQVLGYFRSTPNDTLSGYIIKILTPLYTYEPARTQKAIFESGQLANMPNFVFSRSVSQFLVKLIVVQSQALLMIFFKERKQLFMQLISVYEANKREEEYMGEIVYILGEIVGKLWSEKHKELGKMAPTLIKMIETVLTKPRLHNQQALIHSIMSNIVNFSDNAAYLIKIIINKACKQLSSPGQELIKTSKKTQVAKLGVKKHYLLRCLSLAFLHCKKIVQELPNLHTYPCMLLGLLSRHEWNSMVHVQVETIFKEIFKSTNPQVFKSLFQRWNLTDNLSEMVRKQERKIAQGYAGVLTNIFVSIKEAVEAGTEFGQYVRQRQPALVELFQQYLRPKQMLASFDLAGYRVNFCNSKPQYDQEELLSLHSQFLDQGYLNDQMERLSSTPSVIPQEMLDQIQNQNIINSSWAMKPTQKV